MASLVSGHLSTSTCRSVTRYDHSVGLRETLTVRDLWKHQQHRHACIFLSKNKKIALMSSARAHMWVRLCQVFILFPRRTIKTLPPLCCHSALADFLLAWKIDGQMSCACSAVYQLNAVSASSAVFFLIWTFAWTEGPSLYVGIKWG
jgi:hypothetical protein